MIDVVIPVHNGAATIARTLTALLAQPGSGESWGRVIVVDDASTDDTAAQVAAIPDVRLHLVRLPLQGGRGNACNAGAAVSTADAVLFLDADCRPLAPDLLQRHATALAAGADVSFGRIDGEGPPFWVRLAAEVAGEREAGVASGDFLAMTSCNMAVRRDRFDQVGGFCREYRHYGFEDRDLLATLQAAGCGVLFDRDAAVAHDVDNSLPQLCAKMAQAGRTTAAIFRRRHPGLYRRMKFARVDVHTAPAPVRWLSPVLSIAYRPLCWLGGQAVHADWLPYPLRRTLVRAATALAYLRGTATRGQQRPPAGQ